MTAVGHAPVLECREITKTFAGLRALSDVDLAARPGRVHGLIGPNGAGKTTLINIVTGYLTPTSGHVLIGGEEIERFAPLRSLHYGLRRTFQTPRLMEELSVLENVRLGAIYSDDGPTDRGSARDEWVSEVVSALHLDDIVRQPARELPAGARRLVEIARAVVARPRVLLLDEPLAGLVPVEAAPVLDAITGICRDTDVAVILVEHNLGAVFDVSDEVSVLDGGEIVAAGSGDEVASSDAVSIVFGTPEPQKPEVQEAQRTPFRAAAASPAAGDDSHREIPAVVADSLVAGYGPVEVLHGFNLDVHAGSLTALIGVNGAGKTTALRAMSGLLPIKAGRLEINGVTMEKFSARQAVRAGVAHVPQGRHLFPTLSLEQNLRVAGEAAGTPHVEQRVEEIIEQVPLLKEHRTRVAGSLSGGQQQMVAIARALVAEPAVLLVDEPSLGLAAVLLPEIGQLLTALCQDGMAIILAEQNVTFAQDIADEVALIDQGRVAAHGSADVADELWEVVMESKDDDLQRRKSNTLQQG